jgi:hypothetical protein
MVGRKTKHAAFNTALGALLILTACSSQPLTLDPVYQSGQCGVQSKALRLLEDPSALERLAQQPFNGATAVPEVDFDTHWVVLAAWGQKSTAGYSVTLEDDNAEIRDGALQLPIVFEAPQPDTMQAQVMTAPCLVVAVPKGNYSRLVADGLGIELPK